MQGKNGKLKVGCLHGYGTSKKFLERQMRSFKKELSSQVQFIFLESDMDAPRAYVLEEKVLEKIQGNPKSWIPMKSYHQNYEEFSTLIFQNLERVLERNSQSYDGLLGFSQGGVMIYSILKMMQAGKLKLKCLENMKFVIFVSAMAWQWRDLDINEGLSVPSLHILSPADFLFRKGLFLTTEFKSPQIIYHPFGHAFPRLSREDAIKILRFMRASIKNSAKSEQEESVRPKL